MDKRVDFMKIKKERGFTLVEIIVVIVLLSVIAVVFTVNFTGILKNNKQTESEQVNTHIISAAEAFVSTNPEAVSRLYSGYGYIDVSVGELRDSGLLQEDIKDPETGVIVADEELIRVKVNRDDALEIKYPLSEEEKSNVESLSMEAADLYIDTSNVTNDAWCNNDINVYHGLYRPSYYNDYSEYMSMVDSRLYLYTVSDEDEKKGSVFSGNYFGTGDDEPNLNVVGCNVNPGLAGDYKITYQYYDYYLKENKRVDRRVVVKKKTETDIVSFSAVINNGKKIVVNTPEKDVPIQITEKYADGNTKVLDMIPITNVESQGYIVSGFQTVTMGAFDATVTRKAYNSDGSMASPYLAPYRIVSDTYTLTFDPMGGVANPTSKIVKYETPYGTLANASRIGYTFQGWFDSARKQIKETTIFDLLEDVTLYAGWKPNDYTVLFNPNGGSVNQGSKIVTYDATYGTLPTASRIGYDFTGWFTAPNRGTEITANSRVKITSTQTLYAGWEPKRYTVSFDPRGGSVSPQSKTVIYDASYGSLPTPSRPGCRFEGWYTSPSGGTRITSGSKVSITSNQTLYAHWSKTYTVTFNNAGAISTRSCTAYNEALTCTMVMPSYTTPKYYRMLGWNTNSSGTGTTYSVGSTITVSRDIILYAQSKFEDFSLRLDRVTRSMTTDRIESNINMMFIVDLSGSMTMNSRMSKTKSVMNSIVDKLSNNSTVSIVTHTSVLRNSVDVNLEYGSKYFARNVINNLIVPSGGPDFENYSAGIGAAINVFRRQRNNYPNFTIFITDAEYRSSYAVYISPNDSRLNSLHMYSTTYTVGVGDLRGMTDLLQNSIASDSQKHFRYDERTGMSDFYGIFEEISKDIIKQVPNDTSEISSAYTGNGTVTIGPIAALNGSFPFQVYLGDRLLSTYYYTNRYLYRSGSYYYFDVKKFLSDYGSTYGISDYNKSNLRFRFYKKI